MTSMNSLFDHPLISSRYFFPRYERPREVVNVDVGDASLGCSRHMTHPDAPWLVHFHGNGEVVADYESDLAPRFQAVGLNVFLAEYRGYGASTGTPSMVRMLDDVLKVLAFVGVPHDKIIVYGRSVGSLYAIEAAYRAPTIQGLVIESGIASPLERILFRVRPDELGATSEELAKAAKDRLDHQHKLAHYPGRTLVLHAAHDSMVDRTHAERNAQWAKQSELVLYERGDHNDVLNLNVTDVVKRVARLAGRS
jgi:pimeloyl-ACP methyl ester carboxylesterase